MDDVTIYRANSDYVVGFTPGLAVAFWGYHTRPEYVQALLATVGLAQREFHQPVGLIQITPATAIVPDSATRAALVRMLRQLDGMVARSALVHEAEGFRAAMIRSVVTGLAALSNPGFPHRVFARVHEAAGWMGDDRNMLRPMAIASVVREVRGAIAPRPALAHP